MRGRRRHVDFARATATLYTIARINDVGNQLMRAMQMTMQRDPVTVVLMTRSGTFIVFLS